MVRVDREHERVGVREGQRHPDDPSHGGSAEGLELHAQNLPPKPPTDQGEGKWEKNPDEWRSTAKERTSL